MPGRFLDTYEQVPETKEKLGWAELITLDLSLYEQPGGKNELVKQLEHVVRHVSFFYVNNFDITQEEVHRQFALGREFYAQPLEVKLKYHSQNDFESGEYNGYNPAGHRKIANGINDNIQVYNIPNFDGFYKRQQPPVLDNHIQENESFSCKCHQVVLKLLRLFAILLELPDEEQLARGHQYDVKGEDHLRHMHYAARNVDENQKVADLLCPRAHGSWNTDTAVSPTGRSPANPQLGRKSEVGETAGWYDHDKYL
ncbi:hypothetical protein SCARD494_09482 [Seiridium cardinale]